MRLNHRLRHYRKKAKLSQAELQNMCGWGEGNGRISHYETGRTNVRVDDAKLIIKHLKRHGVKVTLEDFFNVPEVCECCGQEIGKAS